MNISLIVHFCIAIFGEKSVRNCEKETTTQFMGTVLPWIRCPDKSKI